MAEAPRESWITGVGIVSCLGEGREAHWARLNEPPPRPDTELFAPYPVHRIGPLDLDRQVPKKGDQRQMETWQRTGTYTAGLALDDAGVKGQAEILARMDMIVAAGGGERDQAVDTAILAGLPKAEQPGAFLNERLMNDLRPTLFLAQLSNLLAGNISIVHGVTGSSRTFMGEEAAGVDAVRITQSRIAAGQSRIALTGGAYNAENFEVILHNAMGDVLWQGEPKGVWERAANGGGMAIGSIGAFLVIEEKQHALARGAKPLARLRAVRSERARRSGGGTIAAALAQAWSGIEGQLEPRGLAVISGSTGCVPASAEERSFLASHPDIPVRATGTHLGHGMEPQFAMNVALAAIALSKGRLFASFDTSGAERAMDEPLRQVVVTGVGHWRGEGLALLEAVHDGD
jgi:3-oxoacyl-[acyl-carrier-protein] synthase II